MTDIRGHGLAPGKRPPGHGWASEHRLRGFTEVAGLLQGRSEAVCSYLLPAGRKQGQEWVCGDLSGAKGQSLSINLHTGVWRDFAKGPSGADLINLWAAVRGTSQGEAKREAE